MVMLVDIKAAVKHRSPVYRVKEDEIDLAQEAACLAKLAVFFVL